MNAFACFQIVGASATTTRNSMLASGNRFALATLRFAAVLGCQLAIDAILQRASELFARVIDSEGNGLFLRCCSRVCVFAARRVWC